MKGDDIVLKYAVLKVTLSENPIGYNSQNLSELEDIINAQAERGYRLHTISMATLYVTGNRMQATMIFEKAD